MPTNGLMSAANRKRMTVLIIIRFLGHLRLNDCKAMLSYTRFAVIDHSLWQPLAERHYHRQLRQHRILKGIQANGELEVGILLDLLNQIFIGQPKSGLMICAPRAF